MNTIGRLFQHFIALGRREPTGSVAVAASEIETNLGQSLCSVLIELLYLVRIDGHQVSSNITREYLRIAKRALGNLGHMTFDAFTRMKLEVEVLLFLEVAIFALGTGYLRGVLFPQLNYSDVGIVTSHTIDCYMLALEEFLILLVMFDKTTARINLFGNSPEMAITAGRSITIDIHPV